MIDDRNRHVAVGNDLCDIGPRSKEVRRLFDTNPPLLLHVAFYWTFRGAINISVRYDIKSLFAFFSPVRLARSLNSRPWRSTRESRAGTRRIERSSSSDHVGMQVTRFYGDLLALDRDNRVQSWWKQLVAISSRIASRCKSPRRYKIRI